MITSELIKNRINNFWGYGNLKSPVWFIGIEERFDDKKHDIKILEKQLLYSDKYMKNGMVNASRSNLSKWRHLPNMEPFLPNAELQKTWRLPISLYLYLKNNIRPDNNNILSFQRDILSDGDMNEAATLELSSLPAFSVKDWSFYNKYDIPELKSRNIYQKHYLSKRAESLKKLVDIYKPKLVIFYSSNKNTHLPRWTEIVGERLCIASDKNNRLPMYFNKNKNTSFCVIPQPAAGVSYDELYKYADRIKSKINLKNKIR